MLGWIRVRAEQLVVTSRHPSQNAGSDAGTRQIAGWVCTVKRWSKALECCHTFLLPKEHQVSIFSGESGKDGRTGVYWWCGKSVGSREQSQRKQCGHILSLLRGLPLDDVQFCGGALSGTKCSILLPERCYWWKTQSNTTLAALLQS